MSSKDSKKFIKTLFLGESGVGKTCLIAQFAHGKFDPNTVPSLTSQFIRKTLDFPEGKSLNFDLWDIAGGKKYRSLSSIFLKDAQAYILVYDISNEKSFTEMKEFWFDQIKNYGNKDAIIAVAANKNELYEERKVEDKKAEEFAKKNGFIFERTSAKYSDSIKNLIYKIGEKIIEEEKNKTNNVEIEELKKMINELKKENEKLSQQSLNKENEKLKIELNEYKTENEQLKSELDQLKNSLKEIESERDKLNND